MMHENEEKNTSNRHSKLKGPACFNYEQIATAKELTTKVSVRMHNEVTD
jgi:hypothetical protein